jgi:GntR family transcriptional regulator, galactonate operon transcriptional repressor
VAAYTQRGVHGHIVHTLGRRILSGALKPGHVFDPAAIEDDFGVSRTAVREAMKVLAAKGLVDSRQKRGTFVRPRADWNLLDADVIRWQFEGRGRRQFLDMLAEVRGIVEPAGARLAAERRTDEDLRALNDALAAMEKASDNGSSMVDADLSFHRALLAATHNELLTRMEMVIEAGLAERDRLVHAGRAEDPLPSHRAVLDAVEAAEPARAEEAMVALLAQAQRDVEKHRRNGRRAKKKQT